jgi:glycosyltransferase involved in cell wall biosynthesis
MAPEPHARAGRTVLVHDWLTGMRGGERVLESLCRLLPDADVLTLVHRRGSVSPQIERHRIRQSAVARLPGAARRYREYLPAFPAAIEWFDLDDVDLVVSTSHCAAKAVVGPGRAPHLCYCHSPMRYGWDQFDAYFGPDRLGGARSALARHVMAGLARWDRATATRVDRFVANSRYVAGRIRRYYNRTASVLYPPVDTEFFTPGVPSADGYFLIVSALVPYKRIDRAVVAANELGAPLTIVGSGPDEARLRALAGDSVRFAGTVDAEALRDTYRGAAALLLPGEEDFGIAPVEAMACGRPVIALGRGGATETVVPGVTGTLVDDGSAGALADAMRDVGTRAFDEAAIRSHAEQFGRDRFEAAMSTLIADMRRQTRRPC